MGVRGFICVAAVLAGFAAVPVANAKGDVVAAEYGEPTDRYAHGVLGDAIEWGALTLTVRDCAACAPGQEMQFVVRLPETHVFEDVAPRLVDVDGDGRREVMVVESSLRQGARLAVYDEAGVHVATPYIGRAHRWLAPVGAADLDGDGRIELAYVDRPHLAKTLLVWRYEAGALRLVGSYEGVSNHRIGERDIGGGLRNCGTGNEMIVASSDWRQVLAVRFENGRFERRVVGPYVDRGSFAAAMGC